MGLGAIVAAVEELLTRSPTLCLANLAVLEASRHSMARRGRLFSTTPESDDPLLDTVRTRLSSGTLFPIDCKSSTGGAATSPAPFATCRSTTGTLSTRLLVVPTAQSACICPATSCGVRSLRRCT